MKKRVFCFLLVLTLLVPMGLSARAEQTHVWDEYGLLTDSDRLLLEYRADELAERYDCGVYMVIIEDYWEYASSMEEFADSFYLENDLGMGEDHRGILLVLSMADRDFWHKSTGSIAYKEHERLAIEDEFLDDFADDRWKDGFKDFLNNVETYLQCRQEGKVFVRDTAAIRHFFKSYGIALGVGIVLAAIVCGVFYAQMNTAIRQTSAGAYVPEHGTEFTVRTDRYTHTTTSRVKIQSDSGSSGGGRSSSGGGSSGGGKF